MRLNDYRSSRPQQRPARHARRRYRRSPFLISYWLGPITVIENYLAHVKVATEGLVSELLAFCDKPRSLAEVCAEFPGRQPRELREALQSMERYALLESSPQGTDNRLKGWDSWSPGASFFHFSTKDANYAHGGADDFSGLRKLAAASPLPPRKKARPGAKRVHFARIEARATSEFVQVLEGRRTWREFSKKPMKREQLAELLRLSFGVQGWARIPGVGRLPLKTSPSGGALHPLEAYAAVRRVKGLAEGLYHYDAEGHGLELVRARAGRQELESMLAGQSWFCDAAAVVFVTAVFTRAQWKYGNARAYRVVLAEAGHVCQTFCLAATWLGLAPFCTMAFADSKIEKALRVDGVNESVVYVMGVGTRPRRAATAERLSQVTSRHP